MSVLIIAKFTGDTAKFRQANPDLQAFIGSAGADPAPPQITIAEATGSPDQY